MAEGEDLLVARGAYGMQSSTITVTMNCYDCSGCRWHLGTDSLPLVEFPLLLFTAGTSGSGCLPGLCVASVPDVCGAVWGVILALAIAAMESQHCERAAEGFSPDLPTRAADNPGAAGRQLIYHQRVLLYGLEGLCIIQLALQTTVIVLGFRGTSDCCACTKACMAVPGS